MMKEEEIRKLAEDYIDNCTKKSGFVILAESLKGDFIDLFVAGFMKCLEVNKANEWHYVKDGDLPKDDKQYLVLFSYNYKGKQEMSCGVRDNLHSDFKIHRCYTEQIIAWKEIVLPELKEIE